MFLAAEGTDDRDAGKDFSGYKIQTVDQSLQLCKLWHGNLEQYQYYQQNKNHCHSQDPGHGRGSIQHLYHTTDSHDRSIQYDSEHHSHHLLYLLHIVGTAGDQRCGGKLMVLIAGKADYLTVHTAAQIVSQ